MDPINFWDPYGLGAGGFADTGFGDNPKCEGCFNVDGVGGGLRAGTRAVEHGAARVGDTNRRVTDDIRRVGRRSFEKNTGPAAVPGGTAFVVAEVWGMLTPQSGDDVMFDVAVGIGSGGLGLLGRNLDEAASAAKGLDTPFKRGPRVCSFTAGTPVIMCDGSLKPIEQVEEGEFVLARDETSGDVSCKEVVNPYANPERSIILLELADAKGNTEIIETTDNHPFFVADRGWTRVDELVLGDLVPSSAGSMLEVVGATWTDRIEVVYNFGVDEFHTYFVGEGGAWVHNCFEGGPEKALEKWNKHRSEFPDLNNSREYVEAARDFVRNPPAGALWYKRPRDGRTMVYDPATERFAVVAPDGVTPSTFFRLDATKIRHPTHHPTRNFRSNEEYLKVQAEWD